jgi:hypothetical protein
MKKAIKNNYNSEVLATGVEESGFLIVRGTFKEFGHIMFANRTVCAVAGYSRD